MESHDVNSIVLARKWAKAQPSVTAFIGSLVIDFSEIDDLVQETASQVFANAPQYDPSRPFVAWVLGVARNVVRDHRRRTSRERKLFEPVVIDNLMDEFEELTAEREETLQALSLCRRKLTSEQEQFCHLRYESELSPQEIAIRLKVSSGQVRTVLYRIREQLRVCVERHLRLSGGNK